MDRNNCLLVIDESFVIGCTKQFGEIEFPSLLTLAERFGRLSLVVFHANFKDFADEKTALLARAYGVMTVHVPAYSNGSGQRKSETDPALFADTDRILGIAPSVGSVLVAAGDGSFLYYLRTLLGRGFQVVLIGLPGITHWRLKLPDAGWEYVEYTPEDSCPVSSGGDHGVPSGRDVQLIRMILAVEESSSFLTFNHIVNVLRTRGSVGPAPLTEADLRTSLGRFVGARILERYCRGDLKALRLNRAHPVVATILASAEEKAAA